MQTFGAFSEPPPAAFLVAQHMPAGFTRGLAERLDRLTPFRVLEAQGGEELEAGTVLIAPGGCHLELDVTDARITTRLESETAGDRFVPSVDRLFASAAKQFAGNLLAVVLTGMGDDGREGASQVKAAGGRVIVESEETAVIYGMPRQVVNAGLADRVIPLHEIPGAIQAGVETFQTRRSGGRGC
jgi:two-component system chemotaxis response regulator CheB